MPRIPLFMANWKMHKTSTEALAFIDSFVPASEADVAIFPPFTALGTVSGALKEKKVALGAQNVHSEPKGAFTGEISPAMLVDVGVRYVLVGHSERRALFGENDDFLRQKFVACVKNGLTPVLCVGEALDVREAGEAEAFTVAQLKAVFANLSKEERPAELVVAYEPVWAIGTGRTATAADAEAMAVALRQALSDLLGEEAGQSARILYGGSVKAANAGDFLAQANVDGALVGGASLDPADFAALIEKGCGISG